MAHGTHTSCPQSVLDVLKDVPDARKFLASELQDMAAGRNEYSRMQTSQMPPWSRHIWLAAAEMLLSSDFNI